jgi:hypothetical protein
MDVIKTDGHKCLFLHHTLAEIIPEGWSIFMNSFRKLMSTIHILNQEHF